MGNQKESEYMRRYMRQRYHQRREAAIKLLGGKCSECPETKSLELDHINPRDKEFDLAKIWSCSSQKFWAEIKKCQLLCRQHHKEKTLRDRGQISAQGTHGTLSSFRYCKCPECKLAKAKYMRRYRKRPPKSLDR
jgi:5-methylcytosine-specific restriction endonuclease McrA